jgi:hypothetical protein
VNIGHFRAAAAVGQPQWVPTLLNIFGIYPTPAAFDNVHNLYIGGEGAFYLTPSTSTSATIFTNARMDGIEEALASRLLTSSATSGKLLIGTWDLGCFVNMAWPFSSFPTNSNRGCYATNAPALQHTYNNDFASTNASFFVALTDNQAYGGSYTNYSGTSSDGGVTWSALAAPAAVASSGLSGGCIAAASTTNFLWAPSDGSGGAVAPYYTTNGGSSWTQISVSGFTGGWPFANYIQAKICAAERDTVGHPNTFYLYNWNPSDGVHNDAIVKCTGGGASCAFQSAPGFGTDRQYQTTIKTVPGQSQYLFLAYVQLSGTTNGSLNYYTDGGITKNTVAGFGGTFAVGFGAPFVGHTFPTIVVVGFYNGVYGIWQCSDWDGAKTWQQIGTHPLNIPVTIEDVEGDKVVPNVFYYATNSGVFCSAVAIFYCNGHT